MLGLFEFNGGFYEASIWLGIVSDAQIREVLEALWSLPNLDGCYLDTGRKTTDQLRFSPRSLVPDQLYRLYGQATLPDGNIIACATFVYCGTDRDPAAEVWLDFSVPMSALDELYPTGAYPLDNETHRSWREPLEDWLASMGRALLARNPKMQSWFVSIGFELALDQWRLDHVPKRDPPTHRYCGYLCWQDGVTRYFPTTLW